MKDDNANRTSIERCRDAVGRFQSVYLFLVTLAVAVALLVMGNTLARLIGAAFLVACLTVAERAGARRRRADATKPTLPD